MHNIMCTVIAKFVRKLTEVISEEEIHTNYNISEMGGKN